MPTHITIKSVPPRIRYVSDGAMKTYQFPFAIFSASDLKVYFDDTLQTSSTYTVSQAGNSNGGSVTLSTAPQQGVIITLVRELSIERTTDFQEGSALRAEVLNHELDYQIACQQQIADNLNRSMVLPPYAVGTNVNLTLPTPAAGKAIVWNADGTNLENSNVEINALQTTLLGYKQSAQNAAETATTKASEAVYQASVATNQAELAASKAAEVAFKANKDMDNLTVAGKLVVSQAAFASVQSIDYPIPTSETQIVAPANGYFKFKVTSNGNVAAVGLFDVTGGQENIGFYIPIAINETAAVITLPCLKGNTIKFLYVNAIPNEAKFYYAKGEI